uniref:ERCC3/RAD25/XPB helicase C-terminal domain-containing protein n=1 Tax=Chenopodium quinoa TaxID=63459 RepID=A0A803KZQ9_CHEQI
MVDPDLGMELKHLAQPRPYQEKSLSKMFGNVSSWCSGSMPYIEELPLSGRKCCISEPMGISVQTLVHYYSISDEHICCFTSDSKERFHGNVGLVVTTCSMIAFDGKHFEEPEKVIEEIRNREWGLLRMDEVHVIPAQMFRKVISTTKSHCKLGLTGDKIIVFAYNIFALNEYAMKLRNPMIHGATSHVERTKVLEAFRISNDVNTIFISKVITSLPPDCGSELSYSSVQEQRDLLRKVSHFSTSGCFIFPPEKREHDLAAFGQATSPIGLCNGSHIYQYKLVLTAGDEAVDLEMLDEDADEIALKKARRTSGSMSVMLSVGGMVYTDYNPGHKRGHLKSKMKPKDLSKRYCLFKKRFT